MVASATNFAIGFFGYPFEGQYQQSITIEASGVCLSSLLQSSQKLIYHQFNNTLAPYLT